MWSVAGSFLRSAFGALTWFTWTCHRAPCAIRGDIVFGTGVIFFCFELVLLVDTARCIGMDEVSEIFRRVQRMAMECSAMALFVVSFVAFPWVQPFALLGSTCLQCVVFWDRHDQLLRYGKEDPYQFTQWKYWKCGRVVCCAVQAFILVDSLGRWAPYFPSFQKSASGCNVGGWVIWVQSSLVGGVLVGAADFLGIDYLRYLAACIYNYNYQLVEQFEKMLREIRENPHLCSCNLWEPVSFRFAVAGVALEVLSVALWMLSACCCGEM